MSVTPYVVDSLGDTVAEDGVVTLREAIQAANTNAIVGDAHAGSGEERDVITFSPEVWGGMIELTGGQLEITDSLEIRGPGAEELTIDARHESRVFGIDSDCEISLSGLTIENGTADASGNGGAVFSDGGCVTLSSMVIQGCRATNGAGIYSTGSLTVENTIIRENTCPGEYSTGHGGGIYSSGTLVIGDSAISDNTTGNAGGGVFNSGQMTIENSTVWGNVSYGSGVQADGGGIFNSGIAEMINTSVSDNGALDDGGGIFNAGELTLLNCSVVGNSAWGYNNEPNGGGVFNSGTLHVVNSTLSGNAAWRGAAISTTGSLEVTQSTISDNTAYEGGGIYVVEGSATLRNTIVAGNADDDVHGDFNTNSRNNIIGVIGAATGLDIDGNTQFGSEGNPLNAGLLPLAYNGGPTPTHLLAFDSPALNAGNNAFAVDIAGNMLATDQRGSQFPRIVGDTVDIGAVEGSQGIPVSVDMTGTTGEITLRSIGDGICSLDGIPANAKIVFYADPDRVVNGNEISISVQECDARAEFAWNWFPQDVGKGVFTLGATVYDVQGHVLGGTRLTDTCEIVAAPAYVVNSIGDTIAEDGLITLREAIEAANSGSAVGDAPAPDLTDGESVLLISFDDSLSGGRIVLDGGELEVSSSVAIKGPGAESLAIDAKNTSRAFNVLDAGNVWISGVTIENGFVPDGGEQGGGGIWTADTTLRLNNVIISDCVGGDYGGAVFNERGALTVADSQLLRNSSNSGGAISSVGVRFADSSSLTIMNSEFQFNRADEGGAVFVDGTTSTISCSAFNANSATLGGAIYGEGFSYQGYRATVAISSSAFSNNTAVDGAGVYARWYIDLEIRNTTLSGNRASEGAGGVYSIGPMTLVNSILFANGHEEVTCESMNLTQSNNLFGIDPAFIRDPSPGSDGLWATEDDDFGDLRLTTRSPAIDAGDSNAVLSEPEDLAGNPRIFGPSVDVGAYEHQEDILPGREVPSTVVTTDTDVVDLTDGEISLREAILYSGKDGLGTTVTFEPSLSGTIINLQGAALYLDQTVTINASSLESLTIDAGGRSGVFHIWGTNQPHIELSGLTITGGASEYGGGVYSDSGTVEIDHCLIHGNTAEYGGGVYTTLGSMTIADSIVRDNDATDSGGGIYHKSGYLTVLASTVAQNWSNRCAGVMSHRYREDYASELTMIGCSILGNVATKDSGGLFTSSTSYLVNCEIVANIAGTTAGGARFYRSEPKTVVNCTVSHNRASEAGGILGDALSMSNSIVCHNGSGNIVEEEDAFDLISNLIGTDPAFVRNPSPGTDGEWGTNDDDFGDLRLRDESAAIDAGTVALLPFDTLDLDGDGRRNEPIPFDIDRNPRLHGGCVDIGAYEFQEEPSGDREPPSSVVTTTDDVFDVFDGRISLREAVYYVSTADVGTVVTFDSTLEDETIVLYDSPVYVSDTVTIDASAFHSLVIDAQRRHSVFHVQHAPGTSLPRVTFRGLTLTGGSGLNGGAVFNNGAALVFVECTFSGNHAERGGAIYVDSGSVQIVNSSVLANSATNGGALYSYGAIEVVNSVFIANSAGERGGAAYNLGELTLENSTFTENTARWQGDSIYHNRGAQMLTLKNTILGGGELSTTSGSAVQAWNTLVRDGSDADGIQDGVNGNIIGTTEALVDPGFVRNPSPGDDGIWGTPDDDYGDLHLHIDSLARNAGSNALLPSDTFDLDGDGNVLERLPVDLAGNPRISNGTVNMGAYEVIPPTLPGDLNADNVINSADLDLVRANWTRATQAAAADAVFAGAGNETQPAVYGPVPKEAIANNARRQFASLADFLWEKPSISVKKLAFGAPYRS